MRAFFYTLIFPDLLPGQFYQIYISSAKNEDNFLSLKSFFINNKGYFITNNHVVKGCKQSKINFKEEEVVAELIATDETLDLALLKPLLKEAKADMIYPFTRQTFDQENSIHARGFAPFIGIPEDPGTGSVASALGYYLNKKNSKG